MRHARRSLVLAGAAAAFGLALPAPGRSQAMRRVAVFLRAPTLAEAVTAGLRERGWIPGRNLALDVLGKYADAELPKVIEAALARAPEVIVIATPASIAAAAKATSRTPIVGVDLESDPVAAGFAKSLARPGGNITGIWLDLPELGGKNAQILRELIPGMSAIGALWDERQGPAQSNALQVTALSAGLTLHSEPLRATEEIEPAIERLKRKGAKAAVVFTGSFTFFNRERIVEAALKHKLALASLFTNYPDAGGLLGYGPDVPGMFKQCAGHVDRILRGAKPRDMPIERPVKFELVINAVTAKNLGIVIPESLRLRADRLIDA